jgi:hypothetical protein
MTGNEEIGRLPDPHTYLSPHVVAHRNVDKARVQRINYESLPTRSRRSIFYLLEVYRTKGCKIPRDRIYSLLALCIEGPDIRVDYAIRHNELARNILHGCGDAFCLCSLRIIEHVLPRSFSPTSASREQLSARLKLPANRDEESWYSDPPSIGVQHSSDAHTDTFTMKLNFSHMCEREQRYCFHHQILGKDRLHIPMKPPRINHRYLRTDGRNPSPSWLFHQAARRD